MNSPPLQLVLSIISSTVWQILAITAVSLAFIIFVGIIYPFPAKEENVELSKTLERLPVTLDSNLAESGLVKEKELRETYFDLRRRLAETHNISIELTETEREILNKIVNKMKSDGEVLVLIHNTYEISRFSQKVVSENELKKTISLAETLSRKTWQG